MTVLLLRFIIASLLALSCQGHPISSDTGPVTPLNDSIAARADTYLEKLTALQGFNGVVLLKKEGKVLLRKAYNFSADTASTLYVTPESQFDLRSVAKLFARVAVLQLEKSGKLHPEDSLGTYLPGFPNGDKITIQHLMEHASGLPRELNDSVKNTLALSPEEVVALAAREPLEFQPGTREQYSNVGFQLLYYLIGKVSGETFSGYLGQHIFKPLGMEHSGGNFDPANNREHYAYGHYRDSEGRLQTVDSFPPDDMKQGNLYSTVDDLDRFLSFLDPKTYGSLLHENRISHAGGTRGKRAYVERGFDPGYSIIFLANYDKIPFERLVKDLRGILAGKDVKMPEPVSRKAIVVAPEILDRYTGTYDLEDAGHLLLTIKLEQDSLRVYQNGQNNGVLYPESETVFFHDPASAESMEFVPDGSGGYHMLLDFQGVRWKGVKVPKSGKKD